MIELLFTLVSLYPYAVAVLLGLGVPLLCVTSYSRFGVGLVVITAAFALDVMTQSAPVLRLGLTLYVADLPMLLIGAVAAVRWALRPDVPLRHPGWGLYLLVFFGGLGLGLALHGTAAGVQARGDFYAVAAATYAMTFPIGKAQLRQVMAALAWLATCLMLLCVYRWTVYYGDIRELLPDAGTYNFDGAIRVIGSSAALALGQALLVGTFFSRLAPGALALRAMALPLLSVVMALQHRSVWLASLVGVGMGLIFARARESTRLRQLSMVAILALCSLVLLIFGGQIAGDIQSSAIRAIEGQGTVSARFENWRVTLEDWRNAGTRAIISGREYGSDTKRLVSNAAGERIYIGYGAHSNYVSVLTGTGVLGAAGLAWAYAAALARLYRLYRRDGDHALEAAALLVLIAMQLAYFVAYSNDFLQSLLLGVGLALGATQLRASAVDDPQAAPLMKVAGKRRGTQPLLR